MTNNIYYDVSSSKIRDPRKGTVVSVAANSALVVTMAAGTTPVFIEGVADESLDTIVKDAATPQSTSAGSSEGRRQTQAEFDAPTQTSAGVLGNAAALSDNLFVVTPLCA